MATRPFLPVVKVEKVDGSVEEIAHVVKKKIFMFREIQMICFSVVDGTKRLFAVKDVKDIKYSVYETGNLYIQPEKYVFGTV